MSFFNNKTKPNFNLKLNCKSKIEFFSAKNYLYITNIKNKLGRKFLSPSLIVEHHFSLKR